MRRAFCETHRHASVSAGIMLAMTSFKLFEELTNLVCSTKLAKKATTKS